MPGVRPVLAVIFLWMTAHNILYTFIGPFLTLSGLTSQIGLILLLDNAGAASFPWALLAFMAAAFLCAYFAKKHAFRPGARHH